MYFTYLLSYRDKKNIRNLHLKNSKIKAQSHEEVKPT